MGPSWQARPTQNTCWAFLQRELSNLVQPAEFPVSATFLYISLIGKDLRKEAMTVHCIQDICTVCRYLEFLAFYNNAMVSSWHDIALKQFDKTWLSKMCWWMMVSWNRLFEIDAIVLETLSSSGRATYFHDKGLFQDMSNVHCTLLYMVLKR